MVSERLVQIDFLRAFCIFGVLGRHLLICPVSVSEPFHYITKFWNNGGWIGVDVFFVLSGFLISGLLFREYQSKQTVNLKRFLIRRGLKIYPAFYILIFVTVIVLYYFEAKVPLVPLLAEIFFVQNLLWGRLWDHTWSLAVEEHFYFGFSLLTYFLLRLKFTKDKPFDLIPHIFIIFAIGCFILRLLMVIYKGTNISPTPFRLDSLFFGVVISYYWHFRNLSENKSLKQYKNWLILMGILMLLPMFFFMSFVNPWAFVIGLTTNYIAAGFLLIGFLKTDFSNNSLVKFIAYIGAFSYSIYLWHLPVQYWLTALMTHLTGIDNWFFYSSIYLIGSIIIGILFSKMIEYPILKMRDKYFPALSKPI